MGALKEWSGERCLENLFSPEKCMCFLGVEKKVEMAKTN